MVARDVNWRKDGDFDGLERVIVQLNADLEVSLDFPHMALPLE